MRFASPSAWPACCWRRGVARRGVTRVRSKSVARVFFQGTAAEMGGFLLVSLETNPKQGARKRRETHGVNFAKPGFELVPACPFGPLAGQQESGRLEVSQAAHVGVELEKASRENSQELLMWVRVVWSYSGCGQFLWFQREIKRTITTLGV